MLTHVTALAVELERRVEHAAGLRVGRERRRHLGPRSSGSPMSTVTTPPGLTTGTMGPASVAIVYVAP